MDWSSWLVDSVPLLLAVVLSVVVMYLVLMLLTRLAGLRSFSKLSSFDFAITIAIGSIFASTIVLGNVSLLRGIVALATLYVLQIGVAIVRRRWKSVGDQVDNTPILLMAGDRILSDNLRIARITEGDLRAKLREANVLSWDTVRAVVMETTGDISVLHGEPEGPALDLDLFEGVRGSEELKQSGVDTRQDRES